MRGVDRLVAVGEIGAREQIEQVVGAGAADDAVGVEPEGAADRFAQVAAPRRPDNPRRCSRDRADRPRSPSGSAPSGVSFDDSLKTLATPGAVLLPGT